MSVRGRAGCRGFGVPSAPATQTPGAMFSRILGKKLALAKAPRKHADHAESNAAIHHRGGSACFRGGAARALSLSRSRESMAPKISFNHERRIFLYPRRTPHRVVSTD